MMVETSSALRPVSDAGVGSGATLAVEEFASAGPRGEGAGKGEDSSTSASGLRETGGFLGVATDGKDPKRLEMLVLNGPND